jgi:Mg/Co/Ni transporter MgtE
MASAPALPLAFIDRRPAAAARALTAMEPGDAAAFLQDVPARYATTAISYMSAWAACAVASLMDTESAAAALRGLHYQGAAAILRLMAPGPRERVLAELPGALRRDFRMTLSFPVDTVGAHMNTAILTQRPDHDVADARDLVRRAKKADDACVMVLTESHRLAGVVTPAALLRATGQTPLSEVMDAGVEPLSARVRIATVTERRDWDRYTSLPVVSRRGHVIGALSRETLRRALSEAEPLESRPVRRLPISLAEALAAAVTGLARLAVPTAGSRDDDPGGGRRG